MVLLIDNYDSFTFNIVHAAVAVAPSAELRVVRNDAITPDQAALLNPSHLIISPGPCGPAEAGASVALIRTFAGRIPILGICLGHQCIAAAFNMRVQRGDRPVHGKTSAVTHDRLGVFAGLPSPLTVMRYHSLVVDESAIAPPWHVSAWIDPQPDASGTPGEPRVVMGLRNTSIGAPIEGVQFHPESFLTTHGPAMLGTFLAQSGPALAIS